MRIEVTADHIARGEKRCPDTCAVALALCETTGHQWSAEDDYLYFWTDKGNGKIPMPLSVQEFINHYDYPVCGTPSPFAFDIPDDLAGCIEAEYEEEG